MSTQEILEYYKKFNPTQSLTNHNKAERQLYIGNIPLNLSDRELMELLNSALKTLGKDVGVSIPLKKHDRSSKRTLWWACG